MRGTFLSTGQSLLVRRELEREKAVKEAMIHSVMPPKVAHWLLNPQDDADAGGGDTPGRRVSCILEGLFACLQYKLRLGRITSLLGLSVTAGGFDCISRRCN